MSFADHQDYLPEQWSPTGPLYAHTRPDTDLGAVRLACNRCGKSVSTPFYPVPTDTPDGGLIVRAWIECPECLKNKQPLVAAAPDLIAALVDVLAQFEAGAFVRNTDSDGCTDWAIKATGPLRALAAVKAAIAKATQP